MKPVKGRSAYMELLELYCKCSLAPGLPPCRFCWLFSEAELDIRDEMKHLGCYPSNMFKQIARLIVRFAPTLAEIVLKELAKSKKEGA